MYTNHKNNKFICLLQWLDTKLEITNSADDEIKRNELYKFIIINFYYYNYYANIDFVKQVLKIFFMNPTKEQDHNQVFKYVKFRDLKKFIEKISIEYIYYRNGK